MHFSQQIFNLSDQVKLEVGTTFRRRYSDCHFHIARYPSIRENGSKLASAGVKGVKMGIKLVQVKSFASAEEKMDICPFRTQLLHYFVP